MIRRSQPGESLGGLREGREQGRQRKKEVEYLWWGQVRHIWEAEEKQSCYSIGERKVI